MVSWSISAIPKPMRMMHNRAVRTGLGILAAMGDLNTPSATRPKVSNLALRLGIHTGLVVVGAMGGAGRQEQLALGEVPNVASRIQGLAAPNTVAISDATYRLIQGYFGARTWEHRHSEVWLSPYTCTKSLSESGAQVALMLLRAQRTHTAGRSGIGSRAAPGTVGASQSWTRTGGLTHG